MSAETLQAVLAPCERERTIANFVRAGARLDALDPAALPLTELRVAILCSFTVEPAIPALKVLSAMDGYYLRVYVSPYNQIGQEVLNPLSGLYAHRPDVVFLGARLEELDPALAWGFAALATDEVERRCDAVVATMSAWLETTKERSAAQVVVYNFAVPSSPAFGVLDAALPSGQSRMVRRLNDRLVEVARNIPGVYVLDYDGLVARAGRLRWSDPKLWHLAKVPFAGEHTVAYADWHVQFLKAIRGRSRKVLVLDVDGTLWGGIIGDDGVEGIRLGTDYPGSAYVEFQRAVLNLYHRGVVLALNSKNEESVVLEALDHHPHTLLRPHHFAAVRINWRDKAENMRSLAQELKLGLDAFVFIDDSPVERDLVRRLVPEVLTLELPAKPLFYARVLEECGAFQSLGLSAEDRRRGDMYQAQRARSTLEQGSKSLEDFLRSLEMRVVGCSVDRSSIPRIAQLTQKTNQFNLTTRRYTEPEIAALHASADSAAWAFRVVDRFGDNGIVVVVVVLKHGDEWEIDTLLMSCRVMGRGIETAVLSVIADAARAAGARTLKGVYRPTAQNSPVQDLYASHGFRSIRSRDGVTEWSLDLMTTKIETPAWCPVSSENMAAVRS